MVDPTSGVRDPEICGSLIDMRKRDSSLCDDWAFFLTIVSN